MGHKVHPIGIRLGIVKEHLSVWYAEKHAYTEQLISDIRMRQFLEKKLAHAYLSHITIKREEQKQSRRDGGDAGRGGDGAQRVEKAEVTVHSSRPGIVIGKGGEQIDALRAEILTRLGVDAQIQIQEVRKPDLDASLVAQSIAQQLERRVQFRRAMKRAVQTTMRQGAKGVKVQVSGCLGGAEIARTEWYREGRVPLHTFRADIDYALREAFTTYGVVGVKVWIFRGEVNVGGEAEREERAEETR